MKKMLFSAISAIMFLSVFVSASPARADVADMLWGGTAIQSNIVKTTGLGERDPREIAANIIKIALGFLGIIALVIILTGGFKWMTSGGSDDKIGEAKDMIIAGVSGLIVILAAYGIANFVLSSAFNITNAK